MRSSTAPAGPGPSVEPGKPAAEPGSPAAEHGRHRRIWVPASVGGLAAAAALALVAVVAFLLLGVASGPVRWKELLTSAVWDPSRMRFGAAAMVWGTAAVGVLALALAAPLGWGAALAVHELAPARWRRVLRAGCELLAVVPSIVYGLLGVAFVRPFVSALAGVPGGDSLIAAALVLAAMVLPTVVAVSVDALAAVPDRVREAAAACGLNRSEVVRSAVVPLARRGMGAAVLLGLARALGETIAVFLVVGRADGRLPTSFGDVFARLVRPGQTLTTKLNGPESVLAGTAGPHWAALCALGLVLLVAVAALTALGRSRTAGSTGGGGRGGGVGALGRSLRLWRDTQRRGTRPAGSGTQRRGTQRRGTDDSRWPQSTKDGFSPTRMGTVGRRSGPWGRRARDVSGRVLLAGALAVALVAVGGVLAVVVARGSSGLDPLFWLSPAVGASGGGIRDQLLGTVLLVAVAGLLAAPVGLGLGLLTAEYARPALARWLRTLTLTLGGVPSILLGLWGYWLFSTRLGWGKSWLAGSIVLAVVALPPVAVAVASAVAALPAERREAAMALGLRREQIVLSVLVPRAVPGLVTGLLLGLARAAGETAPLLFTATVFSGAGSLPTGIRESPVTALPTHIFALAQDAADPAALRSAWGAALVLVAVAAVLVLAALPARRRMEANAA